MISSQTQEIFQESDVAYFIRVLNIFLEENPPLTSASLLRFSQTGKLFAKIINKISPDTLDKFNENKFEDGLSSHLTIENLDRLTLAAQNLGVRFGYVYSDGIVKGNINVILHFIFNLLKFHYVLKAKKHGTENKREEDILLEWITSWTGRKVKNFTEDLKNGEIYDVLLKRLGLYGKNEDIIQLQPQAQNQLPVQPQPNQLVKEIIQRVRQEKVGIWMEEDDIKNGNKILNILFCCAIYEKAGGRKKEVSFYEVEEEKVRERRGEEQKEKNEEKKEENKKEVKNTGWSYYWIISILIIILGLSVWIINLLKKK